MKSVKNLSWLVLALCFMAFTSNVSAEEEKKEESKMKKEVKKLDIVEVLVTGVVEKKERGEGKPHYIGIKNADGNYVEIKNKVGGKEVDLEQFVGKSVVAKGKGTVEEKKNKEGKEFKVIQFKEIASIEVAGDSAPKAEEKK